MVILKNKLLILIIFLLTGCSSIPNNTVNSCSIFNERYLWYKHTKKVEREWGTPIYIQLAIIKIINLFFKITIFLYKNITNNYNKDT